MPDLKHRDWLLFSIKSMILSVDQNISTKIVDTANGGKWLIASGISNNNIEKLHFLVNTDKNNNYLYLEDFKVYIKGTNRPLNIPGLSAIMKVSFRISDANGFLLSKKTHTPFVGTQFDVNTNSTLGGFVDKFSSLMPYTLNTIDVEKTYEIILNPDDLGIWYNHPTQGLVWDEPEYPGYAERQQRREEQSSAAYMDYQ